MCLYLSLPSKINHRILSHLNKIISIIIFNSSWLKIYPYGSSFHRAFHSSNETFIYPSIIKVIGFVIYIFQDYFSSPLSRMWPTFYMLMIPCRPCIARHTPRTQPNQTLFHTRAIAILTIFAGHLQIFPCNAPEVFYSTAPRRNAVFHGK